MMAKHLVASLVRHLVGWLGIQMDNLLEKNLDQMLAHWKIDMSGKMTVWTLAGMKDKRWVAMLDWNWAD